MTAERWQQLMADDSLHLTMKEHLLGWHFCVEYDGLLISPTMGEWHTCQCHRKNTRLAFERRCVAAGFKLAPIEDFKNIPGNENIYF